MEWRGRRWSNRVAEPSKWYGIVVQHPFCVASRPHSATVKHLRQLKPNILLGTLVWKQKTSPLGIADEHQAAFETIFSDLIKQSLTFRSGIGRGLDVFGESQVLLELHILSKEL